MLLHLGSSHFTPECESLKI